MSDNEDKEYVERESRSASRSVSPQGSGKSGSRSPAHSPARSRSKEGSRHSRSKSRSRSRSKSRSRSHRSSRRHYSRSRSRSRSHRRRSRSRSHSGEYRRRRSHSHSPMSNRRRHVGNRANPDPNNCIGVFGLSLYTTERDLREVFSKYGPLADVSIVYDQQSRRSRGFAFVYFETKADSKEAKERANGMELDGRRIRVDFSITKRPHTPTPGIYMGRPTYGGSGSGGSGGGGGSSSSGGGGGGGGGPGAPENTTTEDMTEGMTDMMIEIITTDLIDADPHLLTIAVEHIGPVPDLVPTLHVTTDNRTVPVAGSMVLGLLL
ncbi:transformer-2 protein-like protein beta-like [Huso huso]|uniref:Transformer-2 protein-like protein beta-like n=1 Tax=Huso huso TaxID=61971 RepID=A0ABR0ZEU0_HUSHU